MSIKTWPNLFSRNPRTRQIFGPQIPTPIVFLVIFALIIGGVYLITAGLDKPDGRDESDEVVCPEIDPTISPSSCPEGMLCVDPNVQMNGNSISDSTCTALQEENQRLQEALKESEAEQEKLVQQLQDCAVDNSAEEGTEAPTP